MLGRPRTRTARLGPERLKLLHEVFGSSLHAYRVLSPFLGEVISYAVFRRVWDGKEERPGTVESVEGAWKAWAEALIERVKPAA